MDGRAIERSALEIARLAEAALSGEPDLDACARLLSGVHGSIERELRGARAPGQPEAACAPGCAACCTVNVATLGIEGAVAAAWLVARLGEGPAATLAVELLRFHDRVRWLEDEDRISAGERCPLLDAGGRCTIHPVRPLSCRSLSSLDPADCRRALDERVARDGGGEVRMNVLQHLLHVEAVAALQAALARRGLDARCRDVSGMVGAFAAEPGLARRFLAGGRLPLE